jgi:hypothetical protein
VQLLTGRKTTGDEPDDFPLYYEQRSYFELYWPIRQAYPLTLPPRKRPAARGACTIPSAVCKIDDRALQVKDTGYEDILLDG